MQLTVWGLKSCDTCRKAIRALTGAGHDVSFRDVRAEPLSDDDIARLLATHGAAALNQKSATWRGLDAAERSGTPAALLAAHPALMKRPIIVADGTLHLGWTAGVQAALGV